MFLCKYGGPFNNYYGEGETLDLAFKECRERAEDEAIYVDDCTFYRLSDALKIEHEIREITG